MPIVRRQREISQAPIPGVRKTAAETALSRGAGVAAAEAGKWDTVAGLGEVGLRIGVAQFAKLKQEERDKADEVAALGFSNQYAKFEADYFRHEQTGRLKLEGKDALGVPEEFEESFQKFSGNVEAGAVTERQKSAVQAIKARYYQSGYATARRHTFEQMQAYGRSELANKIANGHDAAIVNASDPGRVAMEMAEVVFAIKTTGSKLGLGPEAIEKQVGEFQSKTIDGVVTRLLVNGHDREAKAYFDFAKEQGLVTDGDVLAKLEDRVTLKTTKAAGERAAAEIWEKLAPNPNDDTSPISLDRMEAAARAKWGDDSSGRLDATIDALRSRKQGVNDGRRERLGALNDQVWGAVFKGATLDDLERMTEFVSAPGEFQQKVGEYFRREGEHKEALAASRESRGAAAESRAYTAAARKEKQLEDDSWGAYEDYNTPTRLREMSRGEIKALLPELGRENTTRLLERQQVIQKSDAAYRAAVVDADTFNEVAEGAGLTFIYKPPSTWSKTQKSLAGRLREEVESEIGKQQEKLGGFLSREDKKAIAHQVLDAQAVRTGSWWFQSDRTMRIVDVPAPDRARIEQTWKIEDARLTAAGKPVPKRTHQDIVDAYNLIPKK